jgi:type II secretory pathway pseudopilin PulG
VRGERSALTIVELLLVVVILSILAALAVPEYESYRERARATKCLANLRALGNGLHVYAADNEGWFPSLTDDNVCLDGGGGVGGVDLRFALIRYDSVYWSMVCPSDPRTRKDPNAGNPTYLSYIYLPQSGLELGHVTTPVRVARDSGYFHGRRGNPKSTILFSDQHLEMESW